MSTPGVLDAKILIRTYLRSYFVGAAFNTRGLQTIGLALALEPALAVLYPDPDCRRRAWKRYLKIYNTHPLWTPFLMGVFLALEARIARKQFPEEMLDQVKSTVVFTLSAVGDSFFGGSLTVLWALTTACLVTAGQYLTAFAVGAGLFAALNGFKLYTFILGYRQGFAALTQIRSWDLVNWGRRIKVVNAALLVVLWTLVWPVDKEPLFWAAGVASVIGLAYGAGRFRLNRGVLAALGIAACLFFLWIRL